ncbi:hypothetical protein [uncultured Megasphaera sp.]|uniref:hypothetical protein n=1 Tax=uncultured Megasphaera sp. TaxID=165188 RepID=UPI002591DC31|nr:hypothetical protein [uncultured Megasphaera sp.]
MLKRHVATAALAISLLMGAAAPTSVQALHQESDTYVVQTIQLMEGNWYDHAGNLVLQIHNGTINGCPVLSGFDFAGGRSHAQGEIRILQSTGERKLYLTWDIEQQATDSIKLNDTVVLYRTPTVSYNESIAGIHLRMTPAEVKAVLGEPTQSGDLQSLGYRYGWYYAKEKLMVNFDADNVSGITILKGSPAKLGTTGLGIHNTPEEFAQAYHWNRIPKVNFNSPYSTDGAFNVGVGEYLFFGNHMSDISLSIYNN